MIHPVDIFSPVNAFLVLLGGIITAIIGSWHVKRVTRERWADTVDDYAKISHAKDERIEELEKRQGRGDEQNRRLSRRVAEIEARNKFLMEQAFMLEQYCQELCRTMMRNNIGVPPRPFLDPTKELDSK